MRKSCRLKAEALPPFKKVLNVKPLSFSSMEHLRSTGVRGEMETMALEGERKKLILKKIDKTLSSSPESDYLVEDFKASRIRSPWTMVATVRR